MELVMYAIVALFILVRLYVSLGKVSRSGSGTVDTGAGVIESTAEEIDDLQKEEANLGEFVDSSKLDSIEHFTKKMEKSHNPFDPRDFVSCAKTAFEMLLDSFSNCEKETVSMLTTKAMFKRLSELMSSNEEKNLHSSVKLVCIKDCKIQDFKILVRTAKVIVLFHSEQIKYTTDAEGNVVEGSKSRIRSVSELWTFVKDTSKGDVNWLLEKISNSK